MSIHISQIELLQMKIFLIILLMMLKIKFVIKFQMILPNVIKIWYIKNDNYRLVIKNYGL